MVGLIDDFIKRQAQTTLCPSLSLSLSLPPFLGGVPLLAAEVERSRQWF